MVMHEMKTFSVKNDDCITAVEDFSERTVFVTALISMSTEVVHAHLSEMRDQNKTQKQKKKEEESSRCVGSLSFSFFFL